ncbi:zinc finger CCCH domain-containing protein 41 [Argentina anserina]|uniref:zinc finger CCCH domain-containing protein 41 n=1 Tax=Argentina anserina TaxID=57926 RepID=UPI00217684D0|nr:zinc finger CCCH domain-containing protein 41 [Potentilla anserina]XP_050383612.1 zinc finger CCCH domain-containing protein 41 [Potentilla anserina]
MELKVSSPKPGSLSDSDFVSDPEEKEVSDDDDVDRNHKHRRPDTTSRSMERDTYDQVIARPYRNRNKPFANGHSFRDNDSQASTPSKNYNSTSCENFPGKFDKRHPGSASHPRAPFDLNQRMRANQTFPGDLGPGRGRGRGRDSASWSQRDSRFSSDITAQLGSFPPSMFGGRGMANVSNPQSASWNAFGLLPGIPNGGLDTLHSIGLQGTLRPPIHSSLKLGIPRQRCRDFEERGFCLRGDMCPMEHGVNRIVVEDVQSLSQFNLPVSLPSAHLLGKPTGPGPFSSVSASSTTSMNNKGLHSKTNKSSVTDDASLGGADLYDPDQPLWNNNGPETSDAIIGLQSPRNDETDTLSNDDPSDRHQARLYDNADNEYPIRTVGTAAGSQSTSVSVWGRIGSSKSRSDVKEKIDPMTNYLDNPENETKESLANIQNQSRQGKRIIAEDAASKPVDSLAKRPYDAMRTVRKPSQKALRTLFVNGIPQKSNRREALVSHFQRFGEILDIYIPSNSERAFVQFSKREEAEAALKAPDAVMGNRFIKLWWANRDSIPEDGQGNGSIASESSPGLTAASVPLYSSVSGTSKDNQHSASSKGGTVLAYDASLPSYDNSKHVILNGPKAPPLQKKLENLEQLKEELRKKQEMLDQKRNDFRRQLDKLGKLGGPKGEADTELAAKRRKVGLVAEVGKVDTPNSSNLNPASALHDELLTDKNKSGDTVLYHSPKTSTTTVLQQSPSLKHQTIRPLASLGTPVPLNRYKLDNRPTGFRILPPLPSGFANVAVIKEHFAPYGDISNVELEDLESHDCGSALDVSEKCSARITFATRRSAEKAFLNGKCWEGCDLKFVWLTSSNSSNGGEKSPSTTGPLSADVQSAHKVASTTSQDASASGDAESEHSERKDCVEHMEVGEPSEPSSSPTSGVKESSKIDST